MKIAFLLLCVLGLTIGVNGQTGVSAGHAQWKAGETVSFPYMDTLPDGRTIERRRLQAKDVEIRIGDTVITAEGADVANWTGAGPTSIELRGKVIVRTVISPLAR